MCDRHGRRQGRPHCQCGRHTSKVVHRHPYDLTLQLRSFQLVFRHPPPRSCIVTPASPIRLLLVDDHAILREGLAALLASMDGLEVVGQAGDGATALDMYRDLQPDVVICDLRMVPMDGTEFTAAVRAEYPSARVILLTTYDTDEEVFRGLRAGAASYVLKDVAPAQLVETVQAVHAGRKAIDPAIAAKLAEHVASDGLTARQLEVLQCLAEGRSNLEIASTLYISEGTVKAHIKAIFQKLGARDRTQAVTIGIKRGFIRGL
ncbi:MAG: response regulator transcription factor [Gemmatimonadaceae bacterium]|nr:response regulator transcription factor [Gemmatimonadaceae bacterium]